MHITVSVELHFQQVSHSDIFFHIIVLTVIIKYIHVYTKHNCDIVLVHSPILWILETWLQIYVMTAMICSLLIVHVDGVVLKATLYLVSYPASLLLVFYFKHYLSWVTSQNRIGANGYFLGTCQERVELSWVGLGWTANVILLPYILFYFASIKQVKHYH